MKFSSIQTQIHTIEIHKSSWKMERNVQRFYLVFCRTLFKDLKFVYLDLSNNGSIALLWRNVKCKCKFANKFAQTNEHRSGFTLCFAFRQSKATDPRVLKDSKFGFLQIWACILPLFSKTGLKFGLFWEVRIGSKFSFRGQSWVWKSWKFDQQSSKQFKVIIIFGLFQH